MIRDLLVPLLVVMCLMGRVKIPKWVMMMPLYLTRERRELRAARKKLADVEKELRMVKEELTRIKQKPTQLHIATWKDGALSYVANKDCVVRELTVPLPQDEYPAYLFKGDELLLSPKGKTCYRT